jgi:hypothetical protein
MKSKVPAKGGMCRRSRPRQISWKEVLPRVTIVSDPKKLADLKAELRRRKTGLANTEPATGRGAQKFPAEWSALFQPVTQKTRKSGIELDVAAFLADQGIDRS